jgi:signal transduction histidine kinase
MKLEHTTLPLHDMIRNKYKNNNFLDLNNDLEERRILKSKLIEAERKLAKLSEASQSKVEFFNSTVHEFRNPVSAIMGLSEMMCNDEYKDQFSSIQDYKQCAQMMFESSRDLKYFVDDLLEINRNSTHTLALEDKEWIDVESLIKRCVKLNIGRAFKNKIKIISSIEEGLPRIHGDFRKMKQILVNLLSNSIKYSQADTKITIGANMINHNLVITLQDEGCGMSAEQVDIALKKYGVINNENSDSLGLGLPLVKNLVELHGGILDIDSEPENGTKISIYFKNIVERVS